MMDKRWRKIPQDPRQMGLQGIKYSGPANPDVLLVGIGSTFGPIDDARKALSARGFSVGHAHVRVLAPLPVAELSELMAKATHVVVVEHNQQGQLLQLIEYKVGKALREQGVDLPMMHSVRKYDGTPFLPAEIVARAQEVIRYAEAS
jgi:Pyruvate:ferredoxin oxidoreductase and related 2-oxoacid:ferredoxin oxidoreductases, alpha subunit